MPTHKNVIVSGLTCFMLSLFVSWAADLPGGSSNKSTLGNGLILLHLQKQKKRHWNSLCWVWSHVPAKARTSTSHIQPQNQEPLVILAPQNSNPSDSWTRGVDCKPSTSNTLDHWELWKWEGIFNHILSYCSMSYYIILFCIYYTVLLDMIICMCISMYLIIELLYIRYIKAFHIISHHIASWHIRSYYVLSCQIPLKYISNSRIIMSMTFIRFILHYIIYIILYPRTSS